MNANARWVAFDDSRCIADGPPASVIARLMEQPHEATRTRLVFDGVTGRRVDLDLRGSLAEVLARTLPADTERPPTAGQGRGRPRLGVTAREVTLLPRHWDWLAAQPGGSSVALRRLVERALRESQGADAKRQAREAAYHFMTAMAGDAPGYEEALRALFADDLAALEQHLQSWPEDVRHHALQLARQAEGDGEHRG